MKHFSIYLLLVFFLSNGYCQGIDYPVTSGTVNIGGTELAFAATGKGAPFLIIGSNINYFPSDLKKHFRLYFIYTRANAKKY